MDKPGKNLSELIQLLRDRGLPVEPSEEVQLTRFLLDVNYYRASGYWRYFQVAPQLGDNTFKLGTTLNAIIDAYDFDLGLRNILLDYTLNFSSSLVTSGLRTRGSQDSHSENPQIAVLRSR